MLWDDSQKVTAPDASGKRPAAPQSPQPAVSRSVWRPGSPPIPGERVSPALKIVLAAEILAAYVVARWRMSRRDIRDVVSASRARWGARPAAWEPGSREEWLVAHRLGNAVGRTLRILPTDSRCLVQALVLSRLLSARGISSTLVIGAHSRPDFAAHAWVEHDGHPVLPQQGFHESRLLEL